ncbi:MAG TPA: alcohol dehydrogenase catalytic domain-containing protein [Planctomycetota bacterium]|nr:alcohol dehydrogenase catalytic domain-containing protein [Planctomycetota bacterium]
MAGMRALVIEAGAARLREDAPEPEPAPGEVRVEVLCAGVCATDLALARGYMGFAGVPGHEFVGRALEGPLAGRRVVGEINAGCGRCAECASGDGRHCPRRTVLGILGRPGAFAERLALPERNLLPVPEGLSDEQAVFAEPLAAALRVTEQVDCRGGRRVLVAGDGRLGLLCAHALALAGAAVTVAGRHTERRGLLPPGALHRTGLLEADAPPGPADERWPVAVEATGDPAVLPRLLQRVEPRGAVVVKTTSELPVPLDLARLVVAEQSLLGSRCGRLGPALELLAAGKVPVERWVEARYPLERAADALQHAARPGTLKILIEATRSRSGESCRCP